MSTRDTLRAAGMRPTVQRCSVLDALHQSSSAVTARQVYESVAHLGIDLATVHRILASFREAGLVQIADADHHGVRYILERIQHHKHILECRRCHTTVALPMCHMTRLDQKLSKETGWSTITHAVRFYGTCPQCA